ncbi:ATP synthase subunit b-delta [Candidatus Xiphinematobacter sp. Idaho Grape]|nr:ATP synthase subunit b-delta [Candidatus Xiphinematobacter sp. Idaho Grape]
MKVKKAGRILSRKLFLLCVNQGKVAEGCVFAVVDALIKEKPRQYLQILRELTRRIRLALADSQARVQSAVPLSSRERSLIKKRLISFYDKDLEVQFEDNAEVLGGLHIQIGSEVWDGTVLSYLGRVSSFLLDLDT